MADRVQCVVAYPSKTAAGSRTKFNMDYYLSSHMSMIERNWAEHGMKSWSVSEFPAQNPVDGAEMPYIVQTVIEGKTLAGIQNALNAPEAADAMGDIANFTDVAPLIWVNNMVAEKTL